MTVFLEDDAMRESYQAYDEREMEIESEDYEAAAAFPLSKNQKNLLVPRIITMRDFITLHFKKALVAYLCDYVQHESLTDI